MDCLCRKAGTTEGGSAARHVWKFEVIEKPNDWTKEVKKSESVNGTQQQRYDYWVAFQDYAFQNAQFAKNFNRRKPSMDHWMNFSVGSLDDDLVFKIIEILREESNISQTA